jgi:hypothetical protein
MSEHSSVFVSSVVAVVVRSVRSPTPLPYHSKLDFFLASLTTKKKDENKNLHKNETKIIWRNFKYTFLKK